MIGKCVPVIGLIAFIGLVGCKNTNVTCTSPGAKKRLAASTEKFFKKTGLTGSDSTLRFSDFTTRDIDSVHSDCTALASGQTPEGDHRDFRVQYRVRNEPDLPEMIVDSDFGMTEMEKD